MGDETQDVARSFRALQAAVDAALLGPAREAVARTIDELNATSDGLRLSVDDYELHVRIAVSFDDPPSPAG